MTEWIRDLDELHGHYGTPMAPALRKVTGHVTPAYGGFITASRFCILSTVGPEGTDGSPRAAPLGPMDDDGRYAGRRHARRNQRAGL